MRPHSLLIFASILLFTLSAAAEPKSMTSPKGKLRVDLTDGTELTYQFAGFGVEKLVKGKLGLDFEDQAWPESV